MITPSRRHFLTGAALFGANLALPRWTFAAFAAAPTENRLVVILLRGALDGLSAVIPYGDPAYATIRPELALGQDSGMAKLDGMFALHPALADFKRLYDAGQMVALHGVAIPVRERSHFEAQAILEAGLASPRPDDGWVSRSLLAMGAQPKAVAFGATLPLIARGGATIAAFMPSGVEPEHSAYLERVAMMYEGDPGLKDALAQGLDLETIASAARHEGAKPKMDDDGGERPKGLKSENMVGLAKMAGRMLAEPDGVRVAVLEARGWDTHQRQGTVTGRLPRALKALNDAVAGLEKGMGAAWKKAAVVVVTEFGRTVHMNGSAGTDHGTASCAFVLGGAVNGGRVVADWPGLAEKQLFEGRDLAPTMDVRALLKGVVGPHLGISSAALERDVFPDSANAATVDGLLRG